MLLDCESGLCGMLADVFSNELIDFSQIYKGYHGPVSVLDCGEKCAPYNERAVPFCCDIQHTVPTLYDDEWEYLRKKTDLWYELKENEVINFDSLKIDIPSDQILMACKGHHFCQREYRAISCRAFPFFPYINRIGEFIGLSYYWEYEDRCWIISNLNAVTQEFINSTVTTFDLILDKFPSERESFWFYSTEMRKEFERKQRAITLIHRNGYFCKISPKNGRLRKISNPKIQKYGPYKVAQGLPFPDET
jgi:hypothetical protein